ncbi:MAG: magnesium transporter [Frankiales bacterium]|nr:magnesium transporter [Frankiales bacterium]
MDELHDAGAVRSRVWKDGCVVEKDFDFDRISQHLADEECLFWVDLCQPGEQLLARLAGELSLDPLAVEDAVAHAERAKATRYSTYTFLTVYATTVPPRGAAAPVSRTEDAPQQFEALQIQRVSAFVFPHGIVTIRQSPDLDMDAVVQRWDDNADLLRYGVGALVHGLLDVIVDGHFEAVQQLDDAIEGLEDGLFDDNPVSRQVQRRTYQIRKDLVQLRRVVLPMREVINGVLRHRKDLNASPELDPWYDDLYDHVLRVSEWTESLRDMVSTIFETNLSLQDTRLNNVMKKLTSWAAIIAVPTAITGYFGQNVPYPDFGRESGVLFSTGLIVAVAGALYVYFKRRDWL